MNKSFADLKKSRSNYAKELASELKKTNAPQEYADDDGTYWRPDVDKAGNGEAIVRFLPAPLNEKLPYVRLLNIGFKGATGLWYVENCLKTLGLDDPVLEYNSKLWAAGDEESIKQARAQKAKTTFISNVYIIKDKLHPENEGKVFRFRYGKKIFEKINSAMNPEFEGDEPMNPFDLWEGANFRIRIKNVEGYRNYDLSKFDSTGPLFPDDDKMEAVWKQTHSLAELVAADKFKSYDDLKTKMNRVLGLDQVRKPSIRSDMKSENSSIENETLDEDLDAFKSLMTEDD